MRKVKFSVNGSHYEGYFVGISGVRQNGNGENETIILVEDLEGKAYSVSDDNLIFLGKPINVALDDSEEQ